MGFTADFAIVDGARAGGRGVGLQLPNFTGVIKFTQEALSRTLSSRKDHMLAFFAQKATLGKGFAAFGPETQQLERSVRLSEIHGHGSDAQPAGRIVVSDEAVAVVGRDSFQQHSLRFGTMRRDEPSGLPPFQVSLSFVYVTDAGPRPLRG
ncbi:MAG TPA: hypothetical protein VG448_00010 [Solirubrobacterales bacterium]|nr:hypothetical protein [Solirubrobacterales bacterium]